MQDLFSDQCPLFRCLCVIIVIEVFALFVILLSCGHDGTTRAVRVVLGIAFGGGSGDEGSDHDDDADAHDKDEGGDGRDGVDDDGDAGSIQSVFGIAYSTCHRRLNQLLTGWFFLWLAAGYSKKR